MKKIAIILVVLGMLVSGMGQALGSNALNCVVTGQKNNPACMQQDKVDQLVKNYVVNIIKKYVAAKENMANPALIMGGLDKRFENRVKEDIKKGKLHRYNGGLRKDDMAILCSAVKAKSTRMKVLKTSSPKLAALVLNNLVNECNWIAAKK